MRRDACRLQRMRRGTAMNPAASNPGLRMKLLLVSLFITLSTVACSADDYINDISALLRPTLAGYVTVNETAAGKSELWYGLYDAAEPCDTPANEVPIVLWLQGGPGCASTWGAFYGLGPVLVDAGRSGWRRNPYSWNRRFGLLLIDQPVGTGFSAGAPESMIPQDEMWMASDLYTALQGVFQRHPFLQSRPLFIAGESYAGKYVPSIGHYILQKQQQHAGVAAVSTPLRYNRRMHKGAAEQPPLFKLAGLAIGNGLTDPVVQTKVMADACWYWGLLDDAEREAATHMQDQVVALIQNQSWVAAGTLRSALVQYLQVKTGSPTLLDVRRARVYDADESVAATLNRAWVKKHLSARQDIRYISCNGLVEDIMAKDIMKSCAHLLPDILDHLPVLLYQGQYDAQDGVASSESWMAQLDWNGIPQFQAAHREKWYRSPGPGEVEEQLLGYWKAHGTLTHTVIRDAGHIVPHDAPEAAQAMLERWIFSTSSKLPGRTTASCPPSDPPPSRSVEAT